MTNAVCCIGAKPEPARIALVALPVAAAGVEVARFVLPPGGCGHLPLAGPSVIVPVGGALQVAGARAGALDPVAAAAPGAPCTNPHDVPILGYVLSAPPGSALHMIGSRARGTHGPRSDLDLLALVPGQASAEVNLGRLSLTVLPRRQFLARAEEGAPFAETVIACHRRLIGDAAAMARAAARLGRRPARPDPAHLADLARLCLGRPALQAYQPLALARARWALRTLLYLSGQNPFGPRAALAPQAAGLLDRLAEVFAHRPGALPVLLRAAEPVLQPLAALGPDPALATAQAHFAATGNLLGLAAVADLAAQAARRAAMRANSEQYG